ncbi:MAG: HisA/HisF-related TIM barrel protein, partial [Nitrospinota bacterium]
NTFPERIMVGIDAKNGNAAVRGWKDVTETSASVLAKRFEGFGISGIIYTDISRDGTLSGPNIDAIKSFASSINIPVIASGGVSNIKDIENLINLQKYGIEGVIIGKALYSGAVNLREAIELCLHGE